MLLLKQLQSLGCPTWRDHGHLHCESFALRIYCYVSDSGSDQVRFGKLLLNDTAEEDFTLCVVSKCFMHVTQLIYKSGLLMLDRWCKSTQRSWNYYAALAIISNTWRDVARDVFVLLESEFGAESALSIGGHMPPKCIAGRWGTVFASATSIQSGGSRLQRALSLALSRRIGTTASRDAEERRKKARAKAKSAAAALQSAAVLHPAVNEGGEREGDREGDHYDQNAIVDPCETSTEEHRRKMGKWRQYAYDAIQDEVFWILLDIVVESHLVLEHVMAFQSKKLTTAETATQGQCIAQLVAGKAELLIAEFSDFFQPQHLGWAAFVCQRAPTEEMASNLLAVAVGLHCHHCAAFDRRVVRVLDKRGALASAKSDESHGAQSWTGGSRGVKLD